MATTFRSGKSAYFSITSATGGTINLSSGLDSASLDRMAAALKVTTFGKNDDVYIPGLRSGTVSLTGIWASTYEPKLSALLGSTSGGACVYGPESTATNRRKETFSVVVTKFTAAAKVDDKVTMAIDAQVTGAVTSTHF